MTISRKLLGTVSAVTLAALAPGSASAQSAPEGYTFFIEGASAAGASSFTLDRSRFDPARFDFGAVETDRDPSLGFDIAFGFRRKIDERDDFGIDVSVASIDDRSEANTYLCLTSCYPFGSGSGGSSSVASNLDYQMIDFEYGHSIDSSPTHLARFFGGVSILHFKDSMDFMLFDVANGLFRADPTLAGPTTVNGSVDSEFWGVGPRVGIEGAARHSGSRFGISGKVAGAVFLGELDVSKNVTRTGDSDYPEWNPNPNSNDFQAVVKLEAKVGLDYYISENTVLTVGYQVENFWNVREKSPLFEDDREDELIHGAFARLKFSR